MRDFYSDWVTVTNPAEGDPAGNIIMRAAPPIEEAHEARAGSLARFSGRGAGAALNDYSKPVMPTFKGQIDEVGLLQITAYIKS